jgi:hypothetical protein
VAPMATSRESWVAVDENTVARPAVRFPGYREEASRDEEALSNKRASRDQRKVSSEARRVCRGCEGFHSTKKCYYLLPDQAPECWTPRIQMQKIVDRNLKKDSTLKRDVERWMKDLKEENQD